ncbi:MAG: nucleotidyl transferase AbiEii/AbiGii toxin family protein [Endomicrobium sp.]|jgi:predicted nucleotidyltransferase component of viral defense system|nr:nucleotidyl transferase AbiEii/AbiGii toxin family protein [Endomicrobium sp.]
MNKEELYKRQAELLISVLPHIKLEECFALKGGTAINFFVRDLPRLSVDIDLTYIGFENRDIAFKNINNALERISTKLKKANLKTTISTYSNEIKKVLCSSNFAEIKIEPNYNSRGYIYCPKVMPITEKIVDKYGVFLDSNIIATAELYGGKIHAAVSRQHPRDLFDIKILFQEEGGITQEIKKAFIYTVLADNSTPYELLNPTIKDQRQTLENNFYGMTDIEFTYKDHEQTLQKLIKTLHNSFTKEDREFILSFYSLNPKWDLVNIPNIQRLPAIQWKFINLQKMSKSQLDNQLEKIQLAFDACLVKNVDYSLEL